MFVVGVAFIVILLLPPGTPVVLILTISDSDTFPTLSVAFVLTSYSVFCFKYVNSLLVWYTHVPFWFIPYSVLLVSSPLFAYSVVAAASSCLNVTFILLDVAVAVGAVFVGPNLSIFVTVNVLTVPDWLLVSVILASTLPFFSTSNTPLYSVQFVITLPLFPTTLYCPFVFVACLYVISISTFPFVNAVGVAFIVILLLPPGTVPVFILAIFDSTYPFPALSFALVFTWYVVFCVSPVNSLVFCHTHVPFLFIPYSIVASSIPLFPYSVVAAASSCAIFTVILFDVTSPVGAVLFGANLSIFVISFLTTSPAWLLLFTILPSITQFLSTVNLPV